MGRNNAKMKKKMESSERGHYFSGQTPSLFIGGTLKECNVAKNA